MAKQLLSTISLKIILDNTNFVQFKNDANTLMIASIAVYLYNDHSMLQNIFYCHMSFADDWH